MPLREPGLFALLRHLRPVRLLARRQPITRRQGLYRFSLNRQKSDSVSRIVPVLSPGAHVSASKNNINYVVTEYGVAQLRGKPAGQRARELIGIAHPDFRGELTEQAGRMGIL